MKTSSLTRCASVLVTFALLFGACAKDTDAPSDSNSSVVAASPDSVVPASTTDPNVTVVENPAITELKLTSGGGFTTWQYNVSTLPIAWISGDKLFRGIPNETMNPTVSKATSNRPWPHDSISLSMFLDGIKCRPVTAAQALEGAATFAALGSVDGTQAKVVGNPGAAFFVQDNVRAELALVPTLPGLDACPATA